MGSGYGRVPGWWLGFAVSILAPAVVVIWYGLGIVFGSIAVSIIAVAFFTTFKEAKL